MTKFTLLIVLLIFPFSSNKTTDEGLKDLFEDSFYLGVAVNRQQVADNEKQLFPLLKTHFNSLSPENGLKWEKVHPQLDLYDFEFGDAYVGLGEKLGAFTVGHCLVWHQQVPDWVFEDAAGEQLEKSALLSRMEDHIAKVAGRYKSRIDGWDVVNEAFNEDGSYRESKWFKIAGKDFIKEAFRKAHEIDPDAELYYNDYNMWKTSKRAGVLKLAKEMKAEGIRIDGIGMQGHYMLEGPSLADIEQGIIEIAEAGFTVMITELDVDVLPRPSNSEGADLNMNYANSPEFNPFVNGISPEAEEKLAQRYADLFQLFLKHKDKISRVTLWGLHDGKSWLNNFPVRGRTNYPLLFDRELKLKEGVFEKLREVAGG
ncbi:endo-1,4-beta-xylanase [Algoriphagus sp.]|uniref:endo-1,4-beta-xylanase n=1 Tax=Algoriphagus sp. TaxID=1872435 RepID=UPI0032783AAE